MTNGFPLRWLVAAFVLLGSHNITASAASLTEETFKDRSYLKYVPNNADHSDSLPLVVMLHGCTQTPSSFARGTRMNQTADRNGFVVIYPEQTESANARRCWNWFQPRHITRGKGEAALIAGMTRRVIRRQDINSDRVFLAGLSAGGAMAASLVVAYPDLYAAVGVHSGLEYRAATSLFEALSAMKSGGPDPEQQGSRAYEAMGDRARAIPTIVLHGTEDQTVAPINGKQVARQAVATINAAFRNQGSETTPRVRNQPATSRHRTTGDYPYHRKIYRTSDRRRAVIHYSVEDLGHAWSGGAADAPYADASGPGASNFIWSFFQRHTLRTLDGRVNNPPTLDLRLDRTTIRLGDTITLSASVSDADDNELTVGWKIGDDVRKSGQSVNHSFASPGDYRVTVTASDPHGASAETSVLITVKESGGSDSSTLPQL